MQRGHVNGERYCGNYLTKKVHDLLNEQKKCLINDFIESGNDIPFDSLKIAIKAGYSNCEYCSADKT